MKKGITLIALASALLLGSGCSLQNSQKNIEGNVVLRISEDNDIQLQTKAGDLSWATDSYLLKITNKKDPNFLREGTYGQFRAPFLLPSNLDYVLQARNCEDADALLANNGRGVGLFSGDTTFIVNPGETSSVSCICRMKNARVSVAYDERFREMFKDVTVSVSNSADETRVVEFDKNTNHDKVADYAYFNINGTSANITVKVSATRNDDVVKEYTHNYTIKPKYWTKINFTSNFVGGQADFLITVDETVIGEDVALTVDPTQTLKITIPQQYEANVFAKYFFPVLPTISNIINSDNKDAVLAALKYELISSTETQSFTLDQMAESNGKKVFKNLTPSTNYKFRVSYGNVFSNDFLFTTEAVESLPNNDFSQSSSVERFRLDVVQDRVYEYFFGVWTTNNSEGFANTKNDDGRLYVKDSPVVPVNGAVELSTRGFLSKTPVLRQDYHSNCDIIKIGTLSYEGALDSRPSAISFDYKYAPYNSDKMVIEAKIFDADNREIAFAKLESSNAVSVMTNHELAFLYYNETSKAAKITITVKSGSNSTKAFVEHIHGSYDAAGYVRDKLVGSVLTFDNVNLIYKAL